MLLLIIEFFYHRSKLAPLIDMLRNEAPIYVHYNDEDGGDDSWIGTVREQIGEFDLTP